MPSRHSFHSAGPNHRPLSLLFDQSTLITFLFLVNSFSYLFPPYFTCHHILAARVSNDVSVDATAAE